MTSFLLDFSKETAEIFAASIKAGKFDCSNSYFTNRAGMLKAQSLTGSLGAYIIGETKILLGISVLPEDFEKSTEVWKKLVEGRDVMLMTDHQNQIEWDDIFEITMKLLHRKEAKNEMNQSGGLYLECCHNCLKTIEGPLVKKCGGCKKIRYCSPECAKEDWNKGGHKKVCDKNHIKKAE